ncbi:hypothetical protein [Microbacterium pumilum]|uniref:DUF2178 domain-containing protein n=1 Tax=Microbacterium pumilum TaxID=344165 RepID=A0ABN2RUN8_9MICO
MVYQERTTWATLIATIITVPVYVFVVLARAAGGPVTDVDWVPIMLWTMAASIVGAIVISIVWGILAGMRDPSEVGTSDQRDRDISRFGNRLGYGVLVAGALVALALSMIEADWFWIGNALFFGFALSTLVGDIARVVAYRRGLA